MKSKSTSRLGQVLKRIINVRSWIDWDRMKSLTLYLWMGIKKLFVPQKAKSTESFDSAMKRLKLTEKDILERQAGLLRLTLLMLFCAVLLFIYTLYLLVTGGFKGSIISSIVMAVALVLAFRYHFWYFQIKKRKLGCSIHEWLQQGLKGGKK